MLVWSGVIPFPFDREFTAAPDPNAVVTPCLPEGTTDPVDLAAINVNVYNSTTQTGLAGDVGGSLGKLGVVVSNTDNWSGETLDESGAFPRFFTALIQVGEMTGTLPEELDRIAEHYRPDGMPHTVVLDPSGKVVYRHVKQTGGSGQFANSHCLLLRGFPSS